MSSSSSSPSGAATGDSAKTVPSRASPPPPQPSSLPPRPPASRTPAQPNTSNNYRSSNHSHNHHHHHHHSHHRNNHSNYNNRGGGSNNGGSSSGPHHTSFNSNNSNDINRRRLYVGNLDASVNEYTLLRLFEPFGKITRLDFKGQSRGYCFIEFSAPEEAAKAKDQLNKRVLKKRPMVVSYSKSAPHSHLEEAERRGGGGPSRSGVLSSRPSSFSLLKTHKMAAPTTTTSKIEALERKLAQMGEDSAQNSTNSTKT